MQSSAMRRPLPSRRRREPPSTIVQPFSCRSTPSRSAGGHPRSARGSGAPSRPQYRARPPRAACRPRRSRPGLRSAHTGTTRRRRAGVITGKLFLFLAGPSCSAADGVEECPLRRFCHAGARSVAVIAAARVRYERAVLASAVAASANTVQSGIAGPIRSTVPAAPGDPRSSPARRGVADGGVSYFRKTSAIAGGGAARLPGWAAPSKGRGISAGASCSAKERRRTDRIEDVEASRLAGD